ncbi:molybdenum cofactor biosynthesis protein MoaE [Desulfobacter sp.]|jgi:molybdopterin synthase catalytic subunit|uniref:molybdenum cofactor biosynthesis protein MoaE n=1 Tax=Desulfobacter sp. TaxID=2294 RepID=UPI000E92899B|nr:molybdenum cofactor biosynthesis protein MoaE [Desulfobacter sp.]HBT87999.1 molybdenum cofactor biosynthesis protein MoaE [Desulfobacter sp.]
MDLPAMINQMRNHPDFSKAGMVLYHNGVVRDSSRDGRPVTGLTLTVDRKKLDRIINETRAMPGIVEVLVHINSDMPLMVGDDVMFLAVAGDIREHVIDALSLALNRIKTEATSKTQVFHINA